MKRSTITVNDIDNNYVTVWTDGACSNNQNGAFASAGVGVYFGVDSPLNISEALPGTLQTNQRAELSAIIRALEIVRDKDLLIISDSNYGIKGATEWMKNWKKNGWVNSKKEPVANKDLWMKLDLLLQGCDGSCSTNGLCTKKCNNIKRKVKFKWVKGHSNDVGNKEADKLAVDGIKKKKVKLG